MIPNVNQQRALITTLALHTARIAAENFGEMMTEALFDVDREENDRLVLQASQRREDLINQAVQSFAPHLAGQDGVKAIHLYSTNSSLRKAVREFGGGKTVIVEHCVADGRERKGVNEVQHEGVHIPLPEKADLIVTKSGLTSKVEWLGARLGAMVAVLPEAEDYVRARLDRQGVLVLVGGDQAR